MYDYWMIIVGGVVGLWGCWGMLTGSITIYYQSHKGWGGHKPFYTYYGRGLPLVFMLMGGILVALYLLSRGEAARIPRTTANIYAGYVLVGGIVLSCLVAAFQGMLGFGGGGDGSTHTSSKPPKASRPRKVKGMSLADAAKFLQMPEAELLQTAQNGGIEAQRANGSYVFAPDVLQEFKESRARLHSPLY